MQRVRLELSGQAPARRPRAPARAGDVLLDLQRAVGNCVVGRILARKTKAPSRQTGLRADAVVREYVAKAVAFRAGNADVPARPADAITMRRLGPTSIRAAKPLPAQLAHRQSTGVC